MSVTTPPRSYGKPYVVAERLELLTGPTHGVVRLPRHLDWSGAGRYDLDFPGRIIDLYRTVLIEAASPADLHAHLHKSTLKRLWSHLWLPSALRAAWEQRFPELAAAVDAERRARLLDSFRNLLGRLDLDLVEQDEIDDHQYQLA